MAYSPLDAVEAALTGLREQRKLIDEAIAALEKVTAGQASAPEAQLDLLPRRVPLIQKPAPDKPSVAGLSIPEAAKAVLKFAQRPLTNQELADQLEAAGFPHRSAKFHNTVGSILRRYEESHSDLSRKGNKWYLAG